jgi:hypothetical protein
MPKKMNPYQIIMIVLFGSAAIGMPIFDKLSPLPGAEEVIQATYGSQFAWCIGLTWSIRNHNTKAVRVYILFPACFTNPSAVLVTKVQNERPTLDDSIVVLLGALFIYVMLIRGVWQLVRRQLAQSDQGPSSGETAS